MPKDHYAEQERKLEQMRKERIRQQNDGDKFETPKWMLENTPEKAGSKSPTPGTDTSHPTTQQAQKKTLKEKIDERQKTISGY